MVKKTMEQNVGGFDRGFRFVAGPVLLLVGIAALVGAIVIAAGTVGTVLAALALVVGAVLTATAITQKCPMNSMLGVNTYRGRPETESDSEDLQAGRPS